MKHSGTYRPVKKSLLLYWLFFCFYSAQAQHSADAPIEIGHVTFNGKSTKLTDSAKRFLDSLIPVIRSHPGLKLVLTDTYPHRCKPCFVRNRNRVKNLVSYLEKKSISEILSNTSMDRETNKITLALISWSPSVTPHPDLRRSKSN
jgi:hypothetical protein